ncbi:hypothetical protein M0R45_031260 [Rubus argutus]|uniref:Uncharacterized protein n=1 Tax=Rubus argutus TaxID=59490 RepID=A0AAW1WH01_RUBAR
MESLNVKGEGTKYDVEMTTVQLSKKLSLRPLEPSALESDVKSLGVLLQTGFSKRDSSGIMAGQSTAVSSVNASLSGGCSSQKTNGGETNLTTSPFKFAMGDSQSVKV